VNVNELTVSKLPGGGAVVYLQREHGSQKIRIPSPCDLGDHDIIQNGELVAAQADDGQDDAGEQVTLRGVEP
jgi:hypothetical protein